MQASRLAQSPLPSQEMDGFDDLRAQTIRLGANVFVGTGITLDLLVAARSSIPREAFALVALLILSGLVARWVLPRGTLVAGLVLVGGFGSILSGIVFLFPTLPLSGGFALLPVFAAAVLGWPVCLLLAGAMTAGLVVLSANSLVAMPPETLVATLVLLWLNLLVMYSVAHPQRVALLWAWRALDGALFNLAEARIGQGELGRLSKSLNETCDHLARITRELDRARQLAEDARRAKAEFAAAVSHELRTPLNLIIGFSEMMVVSPRAAYGAPLPAGYAGDIEAIYRNACHISSLIDDILDLSQIDVNRMALTRSWLNLSPVVEEAVSGIAARLAAEGLYLRIEIPADLPEVYADPTRIRQVLINLLVNALRFTNRGGVTVTARKVDREVVVSVADTGVGIAPEDLPYVFEEFRQSSQPERRRGGSGLGLTVSYRFVEMHGGNMWVESRLGEGSVFSFSLPLSANVMASPFFTRPGLLAATDEEARNDRRVIVLDEAGEAARIIERYLDDYRVVRVVSAVDALRLAVAEEPRAIIVTSRQSEMRWLRLRGASNQAIKLPVVSCYLQTSRVSPSELGARRYLVKPVTRDRLRVALRSVQRTLDHALGNILIADDDAEMVQLLSRMVQALLPGCQVLTAADGAECLAALEKGKPDLLLLDLLMPGVDGYAVLEELSRQRLPLMPPVIVVTGKGKETDTIVASSLAVSRPGGMSIAEAMRCLKCDLDVLSGRLLGSG